jgi:hypothetical protein
MYTAKHSHGTPRKIAKNMASGIVTTASTIKAIVPPREYLLTSGASMSMGGLYGR